MSPHPRERPRRVGGSGMRSGVTTRPAWAAAVSSAEPNGVRKACTVCHPRGKSPGSGTSMRHTVTPSTSRGTGCWFGIGRSRHEPSSRATTRRTSCPSGTCTGSGRAPGRETNEGGRSARHGAMSASARAAATAASVLVSTCIAVSTARSVGAGTCTRSPKNDQYSVAMPCASASRARSGVGLSSVMDASVPAILPGAVASRHGRGPEIVAPQASSFSRRATSPARRGERAGSISRASRSTSASSWPSAVSA